MSYFLCLAFPPEVEALIPTAFDNRLVRFALNVDASAMPIGVVTRGKHTSWRARFLQTRMDATSLIGKVPQSIRNGDDTAILVAGITSLLRDPQCHTVAFLAHWMRGNMNTEQVTLVDDEEIAPYNLPEVLLNIREDVRYTVVRYRCSWG